MWRLVAYVGQVRWCWFIDEVVRAEDEGDLAPSLMSTVTCEDVLLMKISIDTLRGGKARFGEVKEFARNYLGITSHRILYRMLRRLCEYGLVRFRRGLSCKLGDYECSVSRTGCRITAIIPTTTGLILASTTSLAFLSYLGICMGYVNGDFETKDANMYRVITHAALNLFNAEQLNAALGIDAALSRSLYDTVGRITKKLIDDGIDRLVSLAGAFDMDTPNETYAFRLITFKGYARKFLRLVLTGLLNKASLHGLNAKDAEALFNDLLNDRVEDVTSDKKYWDLIETLSRVSMRDSINLAQRLTQ